FKGVQNIYILFIKKCRNETLNLNRFMMSLPLELSWDRLLNATKLWELFTANIDRCQGESKILLQWQKPTTTKACTRRSSGPKQNESKSKSVQKKCMTLPSAVLPPTGIIN